MCKKHGWDYMAIISRKRTHKIVDQRKKIAQAMRAFYSTTVIGEAMRRDHTTILYYLLDEDQREEVYRARKEYRDGRHA